MGVPQAGAPGVVPGVASSVEAGHPRRARPWGESSVTPLVLQPPAAPNAPPALSPPLALETHGEARWGGSPRGVAEESHVMGGTIGKASSRFHLCPHKPECHMALLQGHLAWPSLRTTARSEASQGPRLPAPAPSPPLTHWGGPVVEESAVLGAAEAKAGVDGPREGRHVGQRQRQESVAMERDGASHLREGDRKSQRRCRGQGRGRGRGRGRARGHPPAGLRCSRS